MSTLFVMVKDLIMAERLYGSSDYDWIVVLTANITNIKDEWPLSNYDLYRYVEAKYGTENINAIHHYETIEVRDNKGRLILPGGQRVDETLQFLHLICFQLTSIGVRPYSDEQCFYGISQ